MHIIKDIKELKSEKELMKYSSWLRNKKFKDITKKILEEDKISRVSSKALIGYTIEKYFFGLKINSTSLPDIEHLGIEVKTVPLEYNSDKTKLKVKEPLSMNMINYNKDYKNEKINNSSFYKKCKKTLFICYIHEKGIDRSEYIIKYVFLWNMNSKVLSELNEDYQKIIKYIKKGEAHKISQKQHKYLTLCPKHSGKYKDPGCNHSKTSQPFSKFKPERRAYRLKNSYMNLVISRHLGKEYKNGWNIN